MSESKDYYKILGVSENSTEKEIKDSFHKLAFKYHPDRPNGDEKKFKEINEAFQILGNKEKREQYDNMKKYGFPSGGFPGGQASGFNWSNTGFDGFGDFNDIFSSFFNQNRNNDPRYTRYVQNDDIEMVANLTLKESYLGVKKEIVFKRDIFCSDCSGKGYQKDIQLKTCTNCQGKGVIEKTKKVPFFGSVIEKVYCDKCDGEGKVPDKKCPTCQGKKYITETKKETIEIPAGIKNFDNLEVRGMGHYQNKAMPPGNLYLKVMVKKDDVFWREGDNLCTNLAINFSEAALGAKKEIKNLDGKNLIVEINKGIQSGSILKIRNKGFNKINYNSLGDLLIYLNIKTPQKLSKKAQKIFEELKEELKEELN